MDDRSGDRSRREGGPDHGGGARGPEGTEWLDLELSKVLSARADALTRGVAEELIRDAIKERLRERLGPRLEAIGRHAADKLADAAEASLDIEARIAAHSAALRSPRGPGAERAPGDEGSEPQKP
jgi:hypothetical protein